MSFKFDDLIEFQNDIDRAVSALGGAKVRGVLEDAAKPIEATAKAIVQKKSGKVQGSIKTRTTGTGGRLKATVGNHRVDWPGGDYYPPFLEYGHGGPWQASPYPFMRPAFDAHKEDAIEQTGEGIAKLLRESGL